MRLISKPFVIPLAMMIALIVFYSCKNEKVDPVANNPISATCDTANVSYSKVVKPILESRCYGCHSTLNNERAGGGVNLEDFNSLSKDFINGVIETTKLPAGSRGAMPPAGDRLSACSIAQIEKWSKKGSPND